MDINPMDLIYAMFIGLVVAGGLVCLFIFLPKEHDLTDRAKDCYRITQKNGLYVITTGRPALEEKLFNRSGYIYLKKIPFTADCFADGVKAADGKYYKAAGEITVYFPEDRLQIFAPAFGNSSHEYVVETVTETASVALSEAIAEFSGDENALKDNFKEKASKKLSLFGLIIMSEPSLKISEDKNVENA